MPTIGERLKQARLAAGMSQRRLSELAVPLSAMAISNYENDRFTPGSDVLLRLAKALNVRFEYFFRPVSVSLSPPQYRKHSRLPVKAHRSMENRITDAVERYLTVEGVFGEGRFADPALTPIHARSFEDVEKAAEALRASWSLGQDPIDDLCEVLEDRGVKVLLLDAVDPKFDGFSCWANETIPVVASGTNKPGDRQRFTLAHELGHLALALEGPEDAEKLACRFAGAFLVPREAVSREFGARRGHLSVPELHSLKHKWGLSMQAWVRRLHDLGVITGSTYGRAMMMFGQKGWRTDEPGEPIAKAETHRLVRLVEQALAEDLISPSRAAELLGKPLRAARAAWPLGLGAEVI